MWNDDWRNELKEKNYKVWERLCECRNTKNDIKIMSRLVKKYNNSIDAVDCLERITTWVNDWNGQNIDFTIEEYENILKSIDRIK